MPKPELLGPLFDSLPIGVVVLERTGRVVVYNADEERLAGRRRANVLGRSFFTEIAPCLDVRELAGVFREKVASGDLDEYLEVSFPFSNLESPRAVACRLRSFVADNEPYGVLFVQDISTQRAVEQLKRKLAELLVHDLKNPLSIMLTNVELVRRLLASDGPVDSRVGRHLDAARAAGRRLEAMIVDVLDVAHLETGSLSPEVADCDVGALLHDAVTAQYVLAARREQRIELDAPGELVWLLDRKLFRRVIENLLDNALRHTPDGGRVQVRAAVDRGTLLVEVSDEGPGIPVELRDRIFDPYVTTDSTAAAQANRGLGLTFVQHPDEIRPTVAVPPPQVLAVGKGGARRSLAVARREASRGGRPLGSLRRVGASFRGAGAPRHDAANQLELDDAALVRIAFDLRWRGDFLPPRRDALAQWYKGSLERAPSPEPER